MDGGAGAPHIQELFVNRPIYHKLDETIRGHVSCSFLALVLKKELEDRIARDVDRDYIMEPEAAVSYGMIDRVIASRDLAPVAIKG